MTIRRPGANTPSRWQGGGVRTLSLLLVAAFAMTGCDRSPAPDPSGATPVDARAAAKAARAATAEAQRLREITERYYDQHLELNPLDATAQGDHRFDARFGDYVS